MTIFALTLLITYISVQKGLTKNELRSIIAEEVTRAIQAIMPTILEQNMEKTCKMIEERFGVEKEDRQVNEDVVVAGENNDIKRRRGRSGKNLNTENKKTRKKVSFSDKNVVCVFDPS